MGQKVNPISLRLGIVKTWSSVWYARRDYADKLHQDLKIRDFLSKKVTNAGISHVKIERLAKSLVITIKSARPGVLIGKKGGDVTKLKDYVESLTDAAVSINVVEVKKAEMDAVLIAQNVARQLSNRAAFRKVMKRAVQGAMKMGAQGIRINVAGRLGGAEIARMEWYREGRVPLHTLRADVEYGAAIARTTYGIIGVKVFIYKGEKKVGDF